jgi:mono/diheme cytochrome c family protein
MGHPSLRMTERNQESEKTLCHPERSEAESRDLCSPFLIPMFALRNGDPSTRGTPIPSLRMTEGFFEGTDHPSLRNRGVLEGMDLLSLRMTERVRGRSANPLEEESFFGGTSEPFGYVLATERLRLMRMRPFRAVWLALASLPFALAWRAEPQSGFAEELGGPLPGLSHAEDDAFVRGRRLFRWQLWAPSRGAEGINSTECTECHLEPTFGGTNREKELLVAMLPDAHDPSGFRVYPRFSLEPGRRATRREPPPEAELRRTPALFGLGLLEAIPDEALQKLADPEDKNGDGISGRMLQVEGGLGRFGWKAAVSTIERFVVAAFKNELGSLPEPIDQPDFTRLGPNQLRSVTYYIRMLGAPKPSRPAGEALRGKDLFAKIGCASCHVPSFETSATAPAQLRNRKVEAYTDLLLHDMGPGPAVAETGPKPNAREFRTAPLWGLGQVGAPFWHDASAPNLEAAIQKHEGEALAVRERYRKLSEADRKAVRAFLESL